MNRNLRHRLCMGGWMLLLLLPLRLLAAEREVPRFSLLTCGPGEEIYSLFGHTALRMQQSDSKVDLVFNYGIFNFHTPHFVLRFALGETDYLLGATEYKRFLAQYAWEGRWVKEQPLQLDSASALRLADLLSENYLPENRMYRYNFFFDNCSTRPRDLIEKALQGRVVYAEPMDEPQEQLTFRTLIHRYSEGSPWSRLGMDLCLGSEADRPVSRREAMFVPLLLEQAFAEAHVAGVDGGICSLTKEEQTLLEASECEQGGAWPTPMTCSLMLLALVAVLTGWEWKRRRWLWGVDALLLTAAGVAGSILAFLVCFSSHPAVSPNWLLLMLHPLHLLAMPWVVWSEIRGRRNGYMQVLSAILIFFILFWSLIPQNIPLSIVPLALCLLLRCSRHVIRFNTKK